MRASAEILQNWLLEKGYANLFLLLDPLCISIFPLPPIFHWEEKKNFPENCGHTVASNSFFV
jgi:hypothetical protein